MMSLGNRVSWRCRNPGNLPNRLLTKPAGEPARGNSIRRNLLNDRAVGRRLPVRILSHESGDKTWHGRTLVWGMGSAAVLHSHVSTSNSLGPIQNTITRSARNLSSMTFPSSHISQRTGKEPAPPSVLPPPYFALRPSPEPDNIILVLDPDEHADNKGKDKKFLPLFVHDRHDRKTPERGQRASG